MVPSLSDHQLCQLLGGLTGNEKFKKNNLRGDAILDVLFTECDVFRAPFLFSDTFVCKERFPLYTEILKPSRSSLVDMLKENFNQVCLISDSVFKGRDGLFFVCLTDDHNKPRDWLSSMHLLNLHITQLDSDYFLMAPVRSFMNYDV